MTRGRSKPAMTLSTLQGMPIATAGGLLLTMLDSTHTSAVFYLAAIAS